MLNATLRINMTGLREDPREEAERYRAAIEMAVYAERAGFTAVNLEEHHCAENGWLPSPLVLAAMIIARTERITVSVTALLVTLYDPIRLAEDIAVLDLVGGGRFVFTAGMGYRPIEYHATGRSWTDRGRLLDEHIETLLLAWKGEPFDYRGQRIRVTPSPATRPHPFFSIGGSTRAAARRAVRFGLPFLPAITDPDLNAYYLDECERADVAPVLLDPGAGNSMLIVEEAPERAWPELAPYLRRELDEYSSWKLDSVPRPGEDPAATVEALRAQGRFRILSVSETLRQIESGERSGAVVHPLVGGLPLERGWSQLRCFATQVLAPSLGPEA